MSTAALTTADVQPATYSTLRRFGPELPALDAIGLGYIRDDLLARAAVAEKQAADAWTERNIGLVQRCEGIASACREAARQIVYYSREETWQA